MPQSMPKRCPGTDARICHVPALGRRPSLTAGVLVALLVGLAGCGSENGDEPVPPSKAAVECREKWEKLESQVADLDSTTTPSDLASRWNGVSATVAHYAGAASGKDCGKTIAGQEEAIEALTAFSTRLVPYDMEAQLAKVRTGAEEYAASPRPTPPAPSPAPGKSAKKNKSAKQAPVNTAPTPKAVAAALKVLTEQAPLASEQQGPGWEQAEVVELDDPAAVAKAVKDLAFLSSESPAHQACASALATVQAAALASLAD